MQNYIEPLIYLFLGLAAVFWVIRKAQARYAHSLTMLQDYVFPDSVTASFRNTYPQYEDDEKHAFAGLKDFFILHYLERQAGRRPHLGMPSVLVDAAWHSFILNTQAYEEFCEKFFGGLIHHLPGSGARPRKMTDDDSVSREVLETFRACTKHRKHLNSTNSSDPTLFNADREAGLPNGWWWTAAALSMMAHDIAHSRPQDNGGSGGGSSCSSSVGSSCSSSSSGGSSCSSGGSSCGGGGGD